MTLQYTYAHLILADTHKAQTSEGTVSHLLYAYTRTLSLLSLVLLRVYSEKFQCYRWCCPFAPTSAASCAKHVELFYFEVYKTTHLEKVLGPFWTVCM